MNSNLLNILKALVITLLYVVIIELLGFWILIAEAINFENYYKYYFLIQGAFQLIVVLVFIYFVNNKSFKNLIQPTYLKWYLMAVILGISFLFLQTPLKWFYNLLFLTEYQIAYDFDGLQKFNNVNLIASILLVPIGEELLFRGYIQNSLHQKTNTIIAILSASLLFALIHSPYMNLIYETANENWHLFYITMFGGVISGLIYYKSKSVGPSILFHIFWNLTVTIV